MSLLLSLVGVRQEQSGVCLARPCPSLTTEDHAFILHIHCSPFGSARIHALCHCIEFLMGEWQEDDPQGSALLSCRPHLCHHTNIFSHVCFILLGGFFSRKKKKDLPRSAQKKRRKHLGWADQFAWPQGKRSAWLMPQKAIGPGDHPSMWITGLAVASVWSREGIPIQAARHPLFGKAAEGDSCSVLWPQEHS